MRLGLIIAKMKYPKPSPPPEPRTILRKLMDEYQLKAPDVAYFLDVRPQTVRAYLCGARAIPDGHLNTVRRAVGLVPHSP